MTKMSLRPCVACDKTLRLVGEVGMEWGGSWCKSCARTYLDERKRRWATREPALGTRVAAVAWVKEQNKLEAV